MILERLFIGALPRKDLETILRNTKIHFIQKGLSRVGARIYVDSKIGVVYGKPLRIVVNPNDKEALLEEFAHAYHLSKGIAGDPEVIRKYLRKGKRYFYAKQAIEFLGSIRVYQQIKPERACGYGDYHWMVGLPEAFVLKYKEKSKEYLRKIEYLVLNKMLTVEEAFVYLFLKTEEFKITKDAEKNAIEYLKSIGFEVEKKENAIIAYITPKVLEVYRSAVRKIEGVFYAG